jgi:hypothetical protein
MYDARVSLCAQTEKSADTLQFIFSTSTIHSLTERRMLRNHVMIDVYRSCHQDGTLDATISVYHEPETGSYWFIYADGCQFCISRAGKEVSAFRPPKMSVEDLSVYLEGPIMGFVLRLQGTVSLHASAVLIVGMAVGFVGAGGAGKSTVAARYALNGTPVVTDDVLPLEEDDSKFFVRPTVPQIKLWPESVTHLYGRPDALPKLVPSSKDWDKRVLDLTQPGMVLAEGKPPLGAVYLLQPRSMTMAGPQIEPVSPAEGLVALIANSYVNYALSKEMRQHEFKVLSRLVQAVPVRKLTLPETMGDVSVLTELLKEDLARSAQVRTPAFARCATARQGALENKS